MRSMPDRIECVDDETARILDGLSLADPVRGEYLTQRETA